MERQKRYTFRPYGASSGNVSPSPYGDWVAHTSIIRLKQPVLQSTDLGGNTRYFSRILGFRVQGGASAATLRYTLRYRQLPKSTRPRCGGSSYGCLGLRDKCCPCMSMAAE